MSPYHQQPYAFLEDSKSVTGSVAMQWYSFLDNEIEYEKTKGANPMAEDKIIKIGKSKSKKGKGTILIVDDEPSICLVLKEFLISKGFVAHAASMADEALEILNRIEVDLVITNVNMPGMNGLELTRLIKDRYSSHVIILTGYRETCTHENALRVGADALFYKPVKLKDLLRSVNKIIN